MRLKVGAHRWVAGCAGALVFGATTIAVFHPRRVYFIDGTGRWWGLGHQEPTMVSLSKAVADLGDPRVAGAVIAASAVVGAVITRSPRPIVVGAGLLGVTAGVAALLKHWVGRVGPSFAGWPAVHVGGNAYPSGHELLVIVSWGFAASVASGVFPKGGWVAWPVMVIASVSAGVSYVFGPAHWVTDVIGSVGLGAVLLAVCPPAVRGRTGVPVASHGAVASG